MSRKTLWYFAALFVFAVLPLAGCSGGEANSVNTTPKGAELTVSGVVKTTSKTAALSPYSTASASTVYVIDAQAGTVLTSGAIGTDGKFSGLKFTLPTAKSIVVFKAVVASGALHSIVPIDLSNPPAGLVSSQPIVVNINSNSEAIAKIVSQALGLSGILGDGGQTLDSKKKTYADALTLVKDNGGQVLSYSGAGAFELTGNVGDSSLLPAKAYSDFTSDDVLNIKLGGSVTSAYIPTNKPVVNVTVTNAATGKGISGLPASKFTVHLAQLRADGATWLNYNINPEHYSPHGSDEGYLPTNITGNTVIDKGDGSYTIMINQDVNNSNALVLSKADTATAATAAKLTYDPTLIHRIAISVNATGAINQLTGVATASNPNNVVGLVYDFIPGTGKQYVNPNGGNFARDLVTMPSCNECHGTLANHGHHFGSRPDTKICVVCHTVQNKKTGKPSLEFTNFIHTLHMGEDRVVAVKDIAGVDASEIKYPQDQRNCAKCHTGKDSINQVGMKPNEFACKSCHDDSTHIATTQACNECHGTGFGFGDKHITSIATKNNPNVPAGTTTLSFEITDVSVDSTTRQAVIKFKGKLNGSDLVLNTTGSGKTALVDGYDMGVALDAHSPAAYPKINVAYSIPQGDITKPNDFTNSFAADLGTLLDGTKGTLTGPEGGVYTATIGTVVGTIPANASIVTAAIQSATISKGGVNIVYQNVSKTATGYTARRTIVSNDKCNDCHEQLGSKPDFHGGLRNDATVCSFCHNPAKQKGTFTLNASTFVHAIHGDQKRTTAFPWTSVAPFEYPGVLRNCEQCHVPGSYDFSNAVNLAAAQNGQLLDSKVDNVGTIISPISAACFSCHDTDAARSHMRSNGGYINEPRPANSNQESCLVCHGPRGADTTLPVTGAVPTIKTVHRWW